LQLTKEIVFFNVEENIGLMLPCNVELEQIASTIEKKLKKVYDSTI
jgi:hypothetical protein